MPHRTAKPLEILVVDDDPVDRQLIEKAFSDSGANISLHFCQSGAEALEHLATHAHGKARRAPDACLFDINMPGLSGIDLLRKVKADEALRHIPVVMLSSSDDARDMSASYELQASGYVCKPSNYRELREMIAGITHYWASTVSFPSRIQAMSVPRR